MDQRTIILVVDDASANLQLCKGLLGDKFDVRLAKSGKMALEALTKFRPDIILLDIEMPDMSGFEVLSKMNKTPDFTGIPVIFVTSHATEKLVMKAVEYGAVDYVVKPFDGNILRAKIQDALKDKC